MGDGETGRARQRLHGQARSADLAVVNRRGADVGTVTGPDGAVLGEDLTPGQAEAIIAGKAFRLKVADVPIVLSIAAPGCGCGGGGNCT